jgi:probable HAF family extracellular repeat protein
VKKNLAIYITAVTLLGALATQLRVAAQDKAQVKSASHHNYKLIDVGTFGGPQSFYFSSPVVQSVNNPGVAVGGADTPALDPLAPFCFSPDCQILHAFEWRDGLLTDLGTLPGGFNSTAYWINERGLIIGGSENGATDGLTGLPDQIAVLWKDGQIINLGTLGGSFSFANAMNNRGQVVGLALNSIPDPFSFIGLGTQTRAFLWEGGVMRDLGTFGGPDGWAASINERGHVAGWALVDSTPNPVTGQPTQHPFLWHDGHMMDLGTLGGTVAVVGSFGGSGSGASINARGQIIGTSNLAGDLAHHPFLWEGGQLKDLGTLGGDNGEAYWINEGGDIVGRADLPGSQVHHAVLWKNGKIMDLGVPPGQPCSTAIDINSQGQVIIDTGICGVGGGPGSLWENGVLYDLNGLIPANSGLTIGDVNFINDLGEIAVTGVLPDGNEHAVLLIPCDENHLGVEGCDYSLVNATTATEVRPTQGTHATAVPASEGKLSPAEMMGRYRSFMANGYRRFGTLPRP